MDVERGWRLRPVIELEPASFGSCERPSTGTSSAEDKEHAYWRACLAQAGITDLQPISPGAWFVYPDQIGDPATLATILRVHFGDDGIPADIEEEASPLAGGLVLLHDDLQIFTPGCCGDMGDVAEWLKATAHESPEPEMLWIGHPWLQVWRENDLLCIREADECPPPRSHPTHRISPLALRQAVALANQEIDSVVERLLFALRGMADPEVVRPLADRLVGR